MAKDHGSSVARSIWNGAVSFAGIDVPVKVFGAADPQNVRFRELHETDGAEIRHELVDADGHKVDRRQVVKGFEVRSDEYVVLDDDELKAAAAPKRKTVEIEHFVPREQIDPDVYDRPYYLAPQKGGEEGYAVLATALRRTGRVGIGRVVLRSREQLAAVVEADRMLRLHTMRFADELVDAGKLDHPPSRRKPDARLRNMAARLVDGLAAKFQPGRYKDSYRERVLDMVGRKAKGEEIEIQDVQTPEPSDDLMSALEASLKGAKR
jgi:DNA end-binding protein Ku